ncbi:MAG: amylo-alpha-1,6-glucosidase [Methylohalobius sp.]
MAGGFDADPPHLPRGCPAQAWSVACVLEAWWKLSKMGFGFLSEP